MAWRAILDEIPTSADFKRVLGPNEPDEQVLAANLGTLRDALVEMQKRIALLSCLSDKALLEVDEPAPSIIIPASKFKSMDKVTERAFLRALRAPPLSYPYAEFSWTHTATLRCGHDDAKQCASAHGRCEKEPPLVIELYVQVSY